MPLRTPSPRLANICAPVVLALSLWLVPGRPAEAETHVVQPGETLYDIGITYGVDPDALARANNITDPTKLQIGQRLAIPEGTAQTTNGSSQSYEVEAGDTLSGIAELFGVSVGSIVAANNLSSPDSLQVGQRLTIPARPSTSARAGSRLGFVWPAFGDITTYFGQRGYLWKSGRHDGLDIGADYGSAVRAADDGVVVEAETGWNNGYGSYVKIDHGNGLQTLYAHLSAIYVDPWQEVGRGEVIGLVGSTGFSTGPHLHFEVRVQGEKRDPLAFLP